MANETVINAADNPAIANKLVEEALSDRGVEQQQERIPVVLPPSGEVILPGGINDPFEGHIGTAEVRELNGGDEEVIARIIDPGKSLLAILDRAVVSVGGKPADKDTLDMLLAGDREMLLLEIRKATFGDEIVVGPGLCPSCQHEQTFTVHLTNDIEVKHLSEEDRHFSLKCKVGTVEVSLPNGQVQKTIVNSTNKNSAELDTLLLKGCINEINGLPVTDIQVIKDLSIKDRRDILKAITDRNPGPQLGSLKKACQSCGSEVPLPLTLAELFQE
jgi:hypothetical protein